MSTTNNFAYAPGGQTGPASHDSANSGVDVNESALSSASSDSPDSTSGVQLYPPIHNVLSGASTTGNGSKSVVATDTTAHGGAMGMYYK